MKTGKKIAVITLITIMVGGLAIFYLLPPGEPVYNGKRLSVWLEGYDLPASVGLNEQAGRHNADEAVRNCGTNAIPTLLRMLRAKDSPFLIKLIALGRKQSFIKIKYTPAYIKNEEAANGFRALAASASSAVPELIAIYKQRISERSLFNTAEAFESIGPAAIHAVPLLLQDATNTDEGICLCAIAALGGIHGEPELVVPILVKSLGDPRTNVRNMTASWIPHFGAHAMPAVPMLIKLLNDQDANVRDTATNALKRIDPKAAAKAGIK